VVVGDAGEPRIENRSSGSRAEALRAISPVPKHASDVAHSFAEPDEALAIVLEDEPRGARGTDQQAE
jgi:hypothetical protein